MKPTESNPATRAEVGPFRRGSDEEKLFLAAVGMIPRHYRSFDMGAVMDDEEECGTVCCFAALVGLLVGQDFGCDPFWPERARGALGLDSKKAWGLFYPPRWPLNFGLRLEGLRPRTPKYAAVAVQRYMHFYRTGE